MSSNPYENEPGFENANTEHDKKAQKAYVQKVAAIPYKLCWNNNTNLPRFDTNLCAYPSFSVWRVI